MDQCAVKDKNSFSSSPVFLVDFSNNNQKTLSMPINSRNTCPKLDFVSKSWNGYSERSKSDKKIYSVSPNDEIYLSKKKIHNTNQYFSPLNHRLNNTINEIPNFDFKPYDAITNCKSAGIIPYTIHNDTIYFLFQKAKNPLRKKDSGWNDFGGKKVNLIESTAETAAREFSEETSCLFYLKDQISKNSNEQNHNEQNHNELLDYIELYNLLKDNENLFYDEESTKKLQKLIPLSQKYYLDKITEFVLPVYISSKETYISYFVRVNYIPEEELPRAEDFHVSYENRYIRKCKWFTIEEIVALNEKDFHKRLQITKVQQRIRNYYDKGLFT